MPDEGARGIVEEGARRVCCQAEAGTRRCAAGNGVRPRELRAGGVVVLARAMARCMDDLDRCDLAPLVRVQHGGRDRDAEEREAQSDGDGPSEGPARRYDD